MYVLIYLMDISMRKSMLHWSRKHTVHWSISGGVTVAKARAGVHLPATGVSTTLLSFFKRTHHYVSIYSSANRCVNDGAGGDAPRFSPSSRQHRQTGWAGFKTKERVVFLFFSHWCQRHLLGWSGILDISPRLQLIQPRNTFKKRGHSCSPTFSTSSRSTLVQNILRVGGAARGKSTKTREEFSSSLWGNIF